MKLAEALQERADLNRKIEELRRRLGNVILVQEGEEPAEDPAELLEELNAAVARLEELMAAINLTNCRTKANGMTLRINVNVWRGNLDTADEMDAFVSEFAGACDAVKFTPLMRTDMFGTVPEVTEYTGRAAIDESGIAELWNAFTAQHTLQRRNERVLGFVDYAEVRAAGQRVILKYAQVEDKYDRETVIPTLKLYPNGCLSNEWSYTKDIRQILIQHS